MFTQEPTRLTYTYDHEILTLEAWGPNALRVQATRCAAMPSEPWALDEPIPGLTPQIAITADGATITNGRLRATVTPRGKLTMHDTTTGRPLLEEYSRTRVGDVRDPKASALEVAARELRPIAGSDHAALTLRLEPVARAEKLYGMGQYQQPHLDLRGCDLELAQRNSQASVPFLLSSLGYGLLWNNPGVGRAVLGANIMSFSAESTRKLDYWIVADDHPKRIVEAYCAVTGRPPMMPEYGLGFWQSKLRYQTQDEVLTVAREYRRRGLPLDVLVIDFFHWRAQGEWSFDPEYWPDPQAMVDELRSLDIEPMVSIWPTVEADSENWDEMVGKGLLIRSERGFRIAMDFQGNTVHFDATNPAARRYVWEKAKANYGQYGIRLFWLDEAEPEYSIYDFDNWRYHLGSSLAIGNIYPRHYSQGFYEGATAPDGSGRLRGQAPNAVNLVRCAWAGSQKFGALVWSGDIASSWGSLRNQLAAGLHMGVAGIAHWTTDIGGFHGGDPADPGFRELLVRWFQWGAFLPVMRLHGDRWPQRAPLGDRGAGRCPSGADNEVWSYGEEVGTILERYLRLRESLRDYVRSLMREASDKGTPVIRTLFLEFPGDKKAWEVEDEYMFGDKYLVAPVLYPGLTRRDVYFPEGASWREMNGERVFEGGTTAEADAPLEKMPVFERV